MMRKRSGAGLSKPNCFSSSAMNFGSSPCAPRYLPVVSPPARPTCPLAVAPISEPPPPKRDVAPASKPCNCAIMRSTGPPGANCTIMLVSFMIVQFAPGGPVERIIAQLQGFEAGATSRFGGGGSDIGATASGQVGRAGADTTGRYRGAQGLDPKFIAELEKQFGFDKPAPERFLIMVKNYAVFNFGRSYFRDVPV